MWCNTDLNNLIVYFRNLWKLRSPEAGRKQILLQDDWLEGSVEEDKDPDWRMAVTWLHIHNNCTDGITAAAPVLASPSQGHSLANLSYSTLERRLSWQHSTPRPDKSHPEPARWSPRLMRLETYPTTWSSPSIRWLQKSPTVSINQVATFINCVQILYMDFVLDVLNLIQYSA